MPATLQKTGVVHWQSILRDHMCAQIDDRLAGKNPVVALPIFSVVTFPAGPFNRNPNCWAADMMQALTAMAIANDLTGNNQLPATLITPRHTVGAAHSITAVGATYSFVDINDNIITRTILGQATVAGADIRISTLDSDIPAALSFLPVIPDDFYNWFLVHPQTPILSGDQDGNAPVRNIYVLENNVIRLIEPPASQPDRLAFYEPNVANDSGNVWCVVIDNQPVIAGVSAETFTAFDDCGGSTPLLANARMNAAIAAADVAAGIAPTGYTVSNPNLSRFPFAN